MKEKFWMALAAIFAAAILHEAHTFNEIKSSHDLSIAVDTQRIAEAMERAYPSPKTMTVCGNAFVVQRSRAQKPMDAR